ncbi:MAG: hypothetical protein Q9163_003898 [Psora crenata]
MTDQAQAPPVPAPASSEIKYEKATSKVGAACEVGRPDVPEPPADEGRVGSKANFHVSVTWPLRGDDWIDTPQDIRVKTAIWRYKLHTSSNPFFDYVLEISITDDHYNYYFGDETGDSYNLNTWVAGDHLVHFNSKNPTIVSIAGS